MKDEEFDKLLKEQMKSDTYIPEKIDKLFSDFEKNKVDDNHKVYKFRRYLKSVSIAACAMLVIFVGVAHMLMLMEQKQLFHLY